MGELSYLTRDAKQQKPEAMTQILRLFEPKIKKSSQFAPVACRDDLEQELRIQILKVIDRFEENEAPDFWQAVHQF